MNKVSVGNDEKEHVAAAFDGSWQNGGHSSLNGVVTGASLETGKVIDVECLKKYCQGCETRTGKCQCAVNIERFMGGLQAAGVVNVLQRSQWCTIHKVSWRWRVKRFCPGYRNQTMW
jgi:hypothetical protein